jgi:magnesium transporter
MRSSLHAPIPSSTLLKFLKAQSESVCFFSANPRPRFVFDHAPKHNSSSGTICLSRPDLRRMSSSAPRCATVEAGLLNLEFSSPRLAPPSPKRTIPTRIPASERRAQLKRGLSTGSRKWPWKVWPSKNSMSRLRSDDLPNTEDGAMFNLGRSVAVKAASEPRLRCTELDEHGRVVLVNGEFKKSELIAKVGYSCSHILDLRMLTENSTDCFLEISEKSTPVPSLISSFDHRLLSSIFFIFESSLNLTES